MNALKRFYVFGAESADRRVAAALAPSPLDAADRYLKESAFVKAIDHITLRLQVWWLSSEAKQLSSTIRDRVDREPIAVRRQAASLLVVIAVIVHVSLTLLQGEHTGWFWMIIPAMAALFAAAMVAGSRASGPTD
jgi:hypothetical protein